MQKILVTGATGLLGFHIVHELLNQGRSVCALVRSRNKAEKHLPPGCEIVVGDITDPESLQRAVKGCSVIYHCAGLPEQWLQDNTQFFKVNTRGTQNLIQVAEQHSIKKFVYISTVDLFATKAKQTYDEQTPLEPKKSPYTQSKFEADEIVTKAAQGGLPVVIIHPGAIYGSFYDPSQWFLKLICDLAHNKVPLLPPGGLPVVYVNDLAKGCILAELKAKPGERYILSESYQTWRDIGSIICNELGLEKAPAQMPKWLAFSVASAAESSALFTKKPPILHKALVDIFLMETYPNNDKAKIELGWRPTEFSVGVKKTVNSLQKSGYL